MAAPARAALAAAGACAALLAAPGVGARTTIEPYLEVDQTFVAYVKGGSDDVLTYTSLAAGADATIASRRAEGQLSLRYEHQIGWNDRSPDSDILSGIARARYRVTRSSLSVEGGALATRVRSDGFASSSLASAGDATTAVYSLYAGPVLATHVGDVGVNASYRIGYTRVDDDIDVPGFPQLDLLDESVHHELLVSAGQRPGPLPVGWTVSAGYEREDMDTLDQRFADAFVRLDLTRPVSRTLALTAGIGYEDVEISQRRALVDAAGNPVLSPRGRLVPDTSVPRELAYDVDGLIWDVGVLWRPSRRTSAELRYGRRYGSHRFTGSASWQATPHSLLQIAWFDRIDSFGRALRGNLVALPTSFAVVRNPFSGDLTGCVGGADGGACFNDALAGIAGSNYRHRGVVAQYSNRGRLWEVGAGAGYSRRRFIAPAGSVFAAIDGSTDEYYYAELLVARHLNDISLLSGSVYANYLDAAAGGADVSNYGGYVSYNRAVGRHLRAQASIGVDAVDTADIEAIISLLGQVGLQYRF